MERGSLARIIVFNSDSLSVRNFESQVINLSFEIENSIMTAALQLFEQSVARREASAATLDGLGFSAVDTAKMLLVQLAAQPALVQRLQACLASLEPALIEPPEYERGTEPPRRGRRGG